MQKQHVDMHRKVLLRRSLLRVAVPGAAYVPFIGDGDLAYALYRDREVYGADLDASRVSTASRRLHGTVVVADCDGWPFAGCHKRFAVADLDAYSNPYKALVAFWQNAVKCDRVVMFGTDGMRQRITRAKVTKTLPSGTERPATVSEFRTQYNFWFAKNVKPFVTSVVTPCTVVRWSYYTRKHMLYWGAVIDR